MPQCTHGKACPALCAQDWQYDSIACFTHLPSELEATNSNALWSHHNNFLNAVFHITQLFQSQPMTRDATAQLYAGAGHSTAAAVAAAAACSELLCICLLIIAVLVDQLCQLVLGCTHQVIHLLAILQMGITIIKSPPFYPTSAPFTQKGMPGLLIYQTAWVILIMFLGDTPSRDEARPLQADIEAHAVPLFAL